MKVIIELEFENRPTPDDVEYHLTDLINEGTLFYHPSVKATCVGED